MYIISPSSHTKYMAETQYVSMSNSNPISFKLRNVNKFSETYYFLLTEQEILKIAVAAAKIA